MKSKAKSFIIPASLVLIIAVGVYFRFHKLDWGSDNFFHPDEYHIVSAVDRLNFPNKMNPELFSYGSFTVYLIYFTKLYLSLFVKTASLSNFIVGRFYSALFSTLTLFFIYNISKIIFKDKKLSLFTTLIAAAIPGLIQQAHFATPESNLTFWLFAVLYFSIKWLKSEKNIFIFLASLSLGFAMGTKIVALTYAPLLISLPFIKLFNKGKRVWKKFLLIPFSLFTAVASFLISFPYSVLARESFISSMNYETGVGRGTILVFYTRQFINTIPILFQFNKILPYALGPFLMILGVVGFIIIILDIIKEMVIQKRKTDFTLVLVVVAFLSYFLPNAILFAKWTRFVAPSFPFFAIFAAYIIYKINSSTKNKKSLLAWVNYCVISLISLNFVWTLMFFSIYRKPDIRITATEWVNKNLPESSYILTEAGNMLEVPLNGRPQKDAFDFYHLDEDYELQNKLPTALEQSDYFIVQSRRIYYDHQRLPDQFPVTSRLYDKLFSGELGFKKIKEFDAYPQINIAGYNIRVADEQAEETWSVFDHPVVRVYQKIKPLTQSEYEKILEI